MSTRDWRRTEISRRDSRVENREGIKRTSTSGKASVKADFNRIYTSKYQYKADYRGLPLLTLLSQIKPDQKVSGTVSASLHRAEQRRIQ
jgi:hypothetical protein